MLAAVLSVKGYFECSIIIHFNPNKVFLIYTPIASSQSNSPYLRKPAKASNKVLSMLYFVVLKLGMLHAASLFIVVAARLQAWPEKH
jgi:hypothetical protein